MRVDRACRLGDRAVGIVLGDVEAVVVEVLATAAGRCGLVAVVSFVHIGSLAMRESFMIDRAVAVGGGDI